MPLGRFCVTYWPKAARRHCLMCNFWQCHVTSSHSTRGEGGAQFPPIGGGLLQRWGGGPSMESYICHSGGGDNKFSLSVHDMQQQGFTFANRGGGGLGHFALTVHLVQQQGVQAPPAAAHHGVHRVPRWGVFCSNIVQHSGRLNLHVVKKKLPQMFFPPNDTQCHH